MLMLNHRNSVIWFQLMLLAWTCLPLLDEFYLFGNDSELRILARSLAVFLPIFLA